MTYQHRLCTEFDTLYAPIKGAGDDYHGHQAVETPEHIVSRTARIKAEYEDLKRDLTEEINMVETRMIRPAMDAKDSLSIMKKTIKKREDRKLDYERYQNRVDSGLKKTKRSERDNTNLAKAQSDLERATELYEAADENLRNCLPKLLTVTFSLLPHLLSAQIQIQNALLAHYYTMLHTYCTEEGFPSPSPPMDEVIRLWDDAFKPVQQEAESIGVLAMGKTVRTPMGMSNGNHSNGYRRPSHTSFNRIPSVSPARALPPSPNYDAKLKISPSPSPSANPLLSPPIQTPSEPVISASPTSLHTTPGLHSFSPAAPHIDYFSRDRQTSSSSIHQQISNSSQTSLPLSSSLGGVAAKKKPPPPPPPPRKPSETVVYVTALYDFGGQGDGDLAFREGDRIRVVKKTESTDDWWIGELRGVRGAFPANYVQQ